MDLCEHRLDCHTDIKPDAATAAEHDCTDDVNETTGVSVDIEKRGDSTTRMIIEMKAMFNATANGQP
jgi:hypothetical protein